MSASSGQPYRSLPERMGEVPARRLVPPPMRARRVARVLTVAFVTALLTAALAP